MSTCLVSCRIRNIVLMLILVLCCLPAISRAADPKTVAMHMFSTESAKDTLDLDGRKALIAFLVPFSMACSDAVLYIADVKSGRPYIGAPLVVG